MTVARCEQEMTSYEFTEWDIRDRLRDEDAAEAARQARMEDIARGGLPQRGRSLPPRIG
ncbi:MAG: hypothetical protein PHS14_20800 [Elusimicrobia bacterium]|nr:hypothetical protein [Elusimicrobiota bacterium]